jgi:GNAT superfamily N-acetyltransferase
MSGRQQPPERAGSAHEQTGPAPDRTGSAHERTGSAAAPAWLLRATTPADVEALAEIRATVMRPDLERLGRFDEHRVRRRLRDSLSHRYTSIIEIDSELAGCVTVRPAEPEAEPQAEPEPDADSEPEAGAGAQQAQWLEHFYLAPQHQGRGLGSAILRALLARTDAQGASVRLNVLQGSAARRLYERHGFVLEAQDPIDVYMIRPPSDVPPPPAPPRTADRATRS